MNCTIKDCKNKYYAKGFCQKHYDNKKRRGNPLADPILAKTLPCTIGGCTTLIFANGLCPKHNRRLQRHGDANYINPKCTRDGKAKERQIKYRKAWLEENWDGQMAYRAARKARVKQATPPWADLAAIQDFYLKCPEGYHVDHDYPLFGKDICGLHVIENLKYLPALENLKKGNKFKP